MQQEMPLIASVTPSVSDIQTNTVAACDTEQAAMRLCVRLAVPFRKQRDIAELLDMKPGIFNRVLNADHHDQPRYMSRVMQIKLQQICGNRAVDQWADLYAKGMLNSQRTVADREAELLAELEKLRESTGRLDNAL